MSSLFLLSPAVAFVCRPTCMPDDTVNLQRGRKIVLTQAAIVQRGNAQFNQDLKMVCTLYKVSDRIHARLLE